ncbi:c-type cytochrome [Akkermansia sp.]|uniref:c-type cytochrome n=2 Tax=Akkermansia sp. TaxID=1872421 RepID=UPI002670D35D|nr:c-type cytochrome [Akkermansia sp.]MEE0764169.1 c-type cytochrome [Akkermansia sp.]
MMKNSAPAPSPSGFHPGERLPLFWLAAACVLGLSWSLTYAFGFLFGEPLPWPAGRLMFAFYGILVYGWALPVLFSRMNGTEGKWTRLAAWCWHGCLVLGLASIAAGNGSGLLLMPFDWWVCPVFALIAAGMACAVWSGPLVWPLRLLFCSSAGCMAAALLVLWHTRALSMNGLLDSYSLEACFSWGIACAALGAGALRLGLASGRWFRVLSIWMALVLAAAPLIGGLARLQGFPVPWVLAEAGMAWSWCAATAVVLAALHLWMASGTESGTWLKTGCSLLALGAVWNVFAGSMPETAQFSLSSWHEAELWAFLGAGVLMMAGRPPETGKLSPAWWMLAAGIGGVLLVYAVGVAASVDVAAFPYAKRAELMSGWVGMSACVHAVAMLLCLAGALWMWKPDSAGKPDQLGTLRMLPALGAAVAVVFVALAAVLLHAPSPSSLEVKRPVQNAEGARIYAAEGCALCHTQVIRRSMSGRDWQTAIDRGTDPDFPYRVSEPEDADAEFNREGAPQMGVASVGPDLSNAAEYVAGRLEYEDAVSRSTRRAAQPQEWLALHLYNPREPQFRTPWSVCAAMPGVFEYRRIQGNAPSAGALPVLTEPGWELAPSSRGRHLLNYLSSLRRLEPERKRDAGDSFAEMSHIHPEYAAHPPVVDRERLKKARAAAVMEKGRSVYLSKCAICHGSDGMGDKVTYPPLAGSEWLKEKPAAEIVKIITEGLTGPITVAGKEWNSTMLPPGVTDPRDLADLLTFLRRHFGGMEGETYTPEQIEEIRSSK